MVLKFDNKKVFQKKKKSVYIVNIVLKIKYMPCWNVLCGNILEKVSSSN